MNRADGVGEDQLLICDNNFTISRRRRGPSLRPSQWANLCTEMVLRGDLRIIRAALRSTPDLKHSAVLDGVDRANHKLCQ